MLGCEDKSIDCWVDSYRASEGSSPEAPQRCRGLCRNEDDITELRALPPATLVQGRREEKVLHLRLCLFYEQTGGSGAPNRVVGWLACSPGCTFQHAADTATSSDDDVIASCLELGITSGQLCDEEATSLYLEASNTLRILGQGTDRYSR